MFFKCLLSLFEPKLQLVHLFLCYISDLSFGESGVLKSSTINIWSMMFDLVMFSNVSLVLILLNMWGIDVQGWDFILFHCSFDEYKVYSISSDWFQFEVYFVSY